MKSKPIALLLIAVFFYSLSPVRLCAQEQEEERVDIAILPIECGEVATDQECASLNDEFRWQFHKLAMFRVMPDAEVQKIAEEQGLSLECMDKFCAAEAGSALGVDKIINGYINQSGDETTLSIDLVDVETVEIVKVATRTTSGPITGLIFEIESLVKEIGGAEPKIIAKPADEIEQEKEREQKKPAKPFYKRGWFVGTVAGVVVAGAVTTIAIIVAGSDEDDEGKVVYEW